MAPLLLLIFQLVTVFTLVRGGDQIGHYISSGNGGKHGVCLPCDQSPNLEV
jgi:hypothetical protein